MSTTTTTTTEDNTDFSSGEDKRRKVAIIMAFCGVGYQGMQRNPGAKTIEGELEEALFHSGAVAEVDRGKPKQYDFARSARTDKGVSAVGQVVSGRFYVDPPGFVNRLNSYLPDQIRVFGYKHVTKSFSSKKFCDRRRYVYLIPVFALDPMKHRDREAVMASLGSGEEYVKCFECSERGRKNKVPGLVGNGKGNDFGTKSLSVMAECLLNKASGLGTDGKSEALSSRFPNGGNSRSLVDLEVDIVGNGKGNSFETESLDVMSECLLNKSSALGTDVKSEALSSRFPNGGNSVSLVDLEVDIVGNGKGNNFGTKSLNVMSECLWNKSSALGTDVMSEASSLVDLEVDCCRNESVERKIDGEGNGMSEAKSKFCYGEKEKERFNSILSYYVGTYNFHNFTTRMKADDPAANRCIISFTANTVINLDGVDLIKCEVLGRSFMLHQIRKMMGLAVAIMRNCAPDSLIQTAFSKDVNITVPMAPEVGLYLDECFFTSYNNTKLEESYEEVSMEAYKEEAEAFKLKHIYSHIGSAERRYGNVALWLHSLNYRNYPDLNYGRNKLQS